MSKPNIILITSHDTGDFISPYRSEIPTPNLQRLAAEGVTLQQHFSTSTVCSPARGALQTGQYPHTNGLMGLLHRGWQLNVKQHPALPTRLNASGYQTHLFGFQHEHPEPRALGYQHVHQGANAHCETVGKLFVDWLKDYDFSSGPFYASMGTGETHRLGLNPSHLKRDCYQTYSPEEVTVPAFLPDCPEVRQDLADFYGAANWLDQMVGQVMDALEAKGIRRETILIYTTDHGIPFMHAKATCYDGGTKVGMVVSAPGLLAEGKQVQDLTSHVDYVPTILDLLGEAIPENLPGISFAHHLKGGMGTNREYAFSERNVTNYFDPTRTVRDKRYRYIRNGIAKCIFDFVIPEMELCSSDFRRNQAVLNHYDGRRVKEELFDLEQDPGELTNLADHPDYQAIKARLSDALDQHLEATDDPFRNFQNPIDLNPDGYTARQQR